MAEPLSGQSIFLNGFTTTQFKNTPDLDLNSGRMLVSLREVRVWGLALAICLNGTSTIILGSEVYIPTL